MAKPILYLLRFKIFNPDIADSKSLQSFFLIKSSEMHNKRLLKPTFLPNYEKVATVVTFTTVVTVVRVVRVVTVVTVVTKKIVTKIL